MTTLNDLSNVQLASVWNSVTGARLSRFANKEAGLKRLRKQLQTDGISEELALTLAGFVKAKPEGVDGDRDHPCRPKPVREAKPIEAPREKVEGVDYVLVTDRHGFKHREPIEKPAGVFAAPRGQAKGSPDGETKAAKVFALVTRPGGATTDEIRETATPFIRQTCRGLRKTVKGFDFKSERLEGGQYRWTGWVA